MEVKTFTTPLSAGTKRAFEDIDRDVNSYLSNNTKIISITDAIFDNKIQGESHRPLVEPFLSRVVVYEKKEDVEEG